MIDVEGIDRAELIAALHNRAVPTLIGRLLHSSGVATPEDVRKAFGRALDEHVLVLDYWRGRPLKITLEGDELHNERLFDRDAGGDGVCAEVVALLPRR